MRALETAEGGFRVSIPESWHVKQIPGDELYQGFFSRERVEKEGDLYTYGLSVVRLRDYRKMYKFHATTPDSIALEFATRVAAGLAGGTGGTVIGIPTGDHGVSLSRYMLLGGKGKECVSASLLIGVAGKKWFHALWEAPCSEAKQDPVSSELTAMIKSLVVQRKWGVSAD